ncbi:MAG TPA: hypothetical protein VF335_00200, partial [Chitinivibrionales bacterium]
MHRITGMKNAQYIALSVLLFSTVVFAKMYTVTAYRDTVPGSLREALTNCGVGDTVVFTIAAKDTVLLVNSFQVSTWVTIMGINQATGKAITLKASGNNQIVSIVKGRVIMRDLKFLSGRPIMRVSGAATRVEIDHCCFLNGVSSASSSSVGGAITFDSASAVITNSKFSGNGSSGDGGALYNNSGFVELAHDTIEGSKTQGYGGYFACGGGTNTITNCVFANNGSSSLT